MQKTKQKNKTKSTLNKMCFRLIDMSIIIIIVIIINIYNIYTTAAAATAGKS